ncbi:hypothetical protein EWI07_03755 [Sporolactobacillus sp. THM7-4]|nr:hypothetical protein EWI07_03755 [Sporolactobacillus sp. THM7-4]
MNIGLSIVVLLGLSIIQSLFAAGFVLALFYLLGKTFQMDENKWIEFFSKHAFGRMVSIFVLAFVLSSIVVVGAGYWLFSATHTDHAASFSIIPAATALPGFIKLYKNRKNVQKSFSKKQ